mmetsp:Transcript_148629/g.386458  ORF Transcript_148629/g.386458 Transcript_148629/m.386458 type:complete len:200 (-) Transcript_148629:639-1238(-)
MESTQVFLLPSLDLLLFADRELRPELIRLVQPRQGPCLDTIFHVVHLLHLREDRLPLLLDPVRQHLRREGDFVQRLEGRHVHAAAVLQLHRGVDVIDRVLEVCQRVRSRARADEPLSLAAAQEADVLHHVGDALLVRFLIDAADVQLDVCLEAARWHGILQHHVAHAVWEDASLDRRVRGQRLVCERGGRGDPPHEATL